ncbi:oligosaccharide repeat unit polymerase [Priestia endophytica]|uniref:oligosaccharide repeat unit polymerase n=1 Tax=Priestia endophytica TaxID=135735 RepID=UPI000DCA8FDB|nr:oligosaccharide repeat unit polymerase [Priestia endophytica]RAS87679.1 hypothetical protein A4U60_06345 [Priestia endophytica]
MFKNNRLIQFINKGDVFSPYIFFPAIFAIYFFMSLFDFGRIQYFKAYNNIFLPVIVGLIAYYIAVFLIQKLGWKFPKFGLSFLKGRTIYFVYLLTLVGLVSYLAMLFTGQIGITDESVRRNLDPKLNFLSSLLWFGGLLIVFYGVVGSGGRLSKKQKISYGVIIALILVAFILMGYRTPIAIMFFTSLIAFHYLVKRVKTSWIILMVAVIGISFSLFGLFRVLTEDTSKEFNTRQGPQVEEEHQQEEAITEKQEAIRKVNETPKWVRALTETMVTGRIVISKIEDYTEDHGYLNGELHKSILGTVLPGEQKSPRMIVTEAANDYAVKQVGEYVTRPGRTTTPTVIGQFYMDGGYVGIVIGMGIFGIILSLLYNRMRQTTTKSYQTIAYGFVTTIFMISIHTGLLDLIFLLMIGFAVIATSIEQDKRRDGQFNRLS